MKFQLLLSRLNNMILSLQMQYVPMFNQNLQILLSGQSFPASTQNNILWHQYSYTKREFSACNALMCVERKLDMHLLEGSSSTIFTSSSSPILQRSCCETCSTCQTIYSTWRMIHWNRRSTREESATQWEFLCGSRQGSTSAIGGGPTMCRRPWNGLHSSCEIYSTWSCSSKIQMMSKRQKIWWGQAQSGLGQSGLGWCCRWVLG